MKRPKQVVLVEHDQPAPAVREEVNGRILLCLALRDARWVRSYHTPDGRGSICQFEAPDAETVREAFRTAGHPFRRAWVAELWSREGEGEDGP